MTDRGDGPWDAPTEHDDQHEVDAADLSGEDPPTMRASESQRSKARGAAIANRLANGNVVAKQPPPTTLPPPPPTRVPATRPRTADDVVVLDRVSGNMPIDHAPRRSESAAGGLVVVATGAESDRIRKLCHKHGLLVPVMTSLAVVHDAMSVVVIGEPSPPAAERVVHVARPTLPDGNLLDLLRALVSGHVVAEPPDATEAGNPKVVEAVRRVSTLTDRGALELATIEAITALTGADRAHCLFHDPVTGALWSEARRRRGGDDRTSMGGLVGWAAQTGTTIYASPAGDDPRWLQELDDPDEGKPQSRLLVQPIVGADRRVHAVLVAVRRWRHTEFSAEQMAALAGFAAAVGPAIDLAVAASPTEPRKTAPFAAAASKSALVTSPRQTSDSRPPTITSPHIAAPPTSAAAKPRPRSPSDERTKVEGGGQHTHVDPKANDDRYSVESILPLPSPPRTAQRPATNPVALGLLDTDRAHERPAVERPAAERPTTGPARTVDKRTGPVRVRASDSNQPLTRRDGDLRDLAVVANDDDAKRAQRIAKKLRLELSTFAKLAEAPDYYRVVTLGETFAGQDQRIAYAARSTITDEQLGDLLAALLNDRVVTPPASLVKPQSAAEARRALHAFAAARKLAVLTDLAAAESLVTNAVRDLLDTDRAYCWLVDPMTGALWSERRKRADGDDRHAIAGIAGWVARTGRAVNAPRASADPRWLGPLDDPEGDPNSQLLVQPIVRNDERVHGVLIAVRRARRPGFTDTDAALLARFSALVTPLLEQIAVAADTQQMVPEDTAARAPLPSASDSGLAALLRGTHPFARWLFLTLGVIAGVVIGLLV